MPLSEARKRANAKWDKAHTVTAGTKVQTHLMESFRDACKVLGVTQGQVFREAIMKTIRSAEELRQSDKL